MLWTVITDILVVIFVLDCAFMGLVIMMQRSKQEGLGAAFGGGITDSIWGAQTSNVLVKATVVSAVIFFTLSLTLARIYSHTGKTTVNQGSAIQQQLLTPVPTATNATTAPVAPTTSAPAPAVSAPAKTTTPSTPAGK